MRTWKPLIACLPVVLAAGCSESDDPLAPPPPPAGPPQLEVFALLDGDGVITHGDLATLRWRAPGANRILLTSNVPSGDPPPGVQLTPEGGSVNVRPAFPTIYELTVANDHGSVTDTVFVDIQYRVGVYVSPAQGDDANTGASPVVPVATLDRALQLTTGGGVIYLGAGVYDTPLAIDGAPVSAYGGLDPATFFEGDPNFFATTIRPSSGIPLSIRNTLDFMDIQDIAFDARNTEAMAGEIVDAKARITNCIFDARSSSVEPAGGAVALRVESVGTGASAQVRSCRIFASRAGTISETRAVSIHQGPGALGADVLVANCFIDGGLAFDKATGVWVESFGAVQIGMCTIGAEILGLGDAVNNPSAIRIPAGFPAIGGNILFARGANQRYGIQETGPSGNPASLEGNLFISVGGTPYDNWAGPDPTSQDDLWDPQYTIEPNFVVGDNILESAISISQIVRSVGAQDFHLRPTSFGAANPAVDQGETWVAKADYGQVSDDIDGTSRPALGSLYDLGADEMD